MRASLRLAAIIPALLIRALLAQEPTDEPDYARAIQAWLASDHTDPELLDRAVTAILDAGAPGIAALARTAHAAPRDDVERRIGIDSMISNVALGALDRARDSGFVYAGQFERLRPLQPEVGRFLVGLVLDTPEWFPEDMRPQVVPALRDVYSEPPAREVVEALADVVRDREFEAEDLRLALSYALAQWGRREFVAARIAELEKNAGEGRTADELWFVHELAGVHYQLRDYPEAADQWQRFLAATRALGGRPAAMDLYNAACCLSLAGRIEPALDALEECCQRVAEGTVDSTQDLTRKMFDNDPDLRALRSLPRFGEAVGKAFPVHEDRQQQERPDDR